MAENTRLKELQAEVRGHSDELRKLMDLLELRDREQRAHTQQVQVDAQARMDKLQQSLELIVKSQSQFHGAVSGAASSHVPLPAKDISLGFPHFNGQSSVLEWIFKAEKFFNYHHTPDADRVDIAAMHFENDVVPWFQMLQRLSAVHSWTELTRALESQFGPSPFDCPMAELFKLHQTSTVSDYYLKFMSLANRSMGLSNEALLNCFLSGLHAEIRRDVVAQTPTSLMRAVALAKLFEDRYSPTIQSPPVSVRRYSPVAATSFHTSQQQSKQMVKPSLPPLLPKPTIPPVTNNNVKKISPAEMQLRRENGLCYFCDDKFTFNHRCPNRQYLFLKLEEDLLDPNYEPPPDLDHQIVTQEVGSEDHHLSLNALKGGVGVGTIRFLAYINKLPVTVLVDGGSSDNFLQPRLAKFLKLPIEPAPMFKVMVGNGNYMAAEGLIQKLDLHAQGNVL